MTKRLNSTLVVLGLMCLSPVVHGASLPYEVVAIDTDSKTLIEVNMETGEQVLTEFPEEYPRPIVLSVKDGSVFFMHEGGALNESLLMEYDPRLNEWGGTVIPGGFPFPNDMDLTHDGTFLLVTTEVTKGFDTLKMFGPEYFSRYRRKTSHGTGTKHVVQHNRRHRYGKFCGSPVG